MANPSFNRSETLREANQTVRETMDQAKARISRNLDNASHMATDFYDRSSVWLQDNYGKALGGAAIVLCAGVIGYFIGRSTKSDLNL